MKISIKGQTNGVTIVVVPGNIDAYRNHAALFHYYTDNFLMTAMTSENGGIESDIISEVRQLQFLIPEHMHPKYFFLLQTE